MRDPHLGPLTVARAPEPPAAWPYYAPQGSECAVFEHCFHQRLPLLIKGPTGCGKTRFVEHMAARLDRPLVTVSCHDDLSAADLVGRHLIGRGDEHFAGAIDRQHAAVVGQRVQHHGGVLARLDHFVEIADAAFAHRAR